MTFLGELASTQEGMLLKEPMSNQYVLEYIDVDIVEEEDLTLASKITKSL